MSNKIIYLILILCFQISAQVPNKILIKSINKNIPQPIKIECSNFEALADSNTIVFTVDRKEDLEKFSKITKNIKPSSSEYSPDVKIKLLAYYDKETIIICCGEYLMSLNDNPVQYSKELIRFVAKMKIKYKHKISKMKKYINLLYDKDIQ
jgi:hypothetical protein